MEYKILAIGDPHLKLSNIPHIRLLKNKIIEVIEQEKPDGVVILGDLHDSHAQMNIFAMIEERQFIIDIAKVSKWFRYIIGNHDIPSNNQYLERYHAFHGWLDDEEVVWKPQEIGTPIGSFAFVPYVPNGRFKEALKSDNLPSENYRAIFCHQEFKNADLGSSIISKNGDEWSKHGSLIISGHVHKRQKMQGNIIYVGSPYQTNFGEEDNKTISLFTFTDDKCEEKLIDLYMPKKITHNVNIEQINDLILDSKNENRVIITDTSILIEQFKKKDKYKELSQLSKVIFKPSDKVFVKRDVLRQGFLDILRDYIKKENSSVSEVFNEVLSAATP